jgi:tetratricopeptide (TPR) repeat protein
MIRASLWCLLIASSVSAAPARLPVVVLLPPQSTEELKPLALLIAARASEELEAAGGVTELHLKQALRVVQEEGVASSADSAEQLRGLMGADRALFFSLVAGTPLKVQWTVADGKKPVTGSAAVGATWAEALEQGSTAVAKALLGKPPKRGVVQPSSTSEEALKSVGRCYATVLRQPLTVDTPSVLDAAELEQAVSDCRAAQTADPKLSFAAATLALAQAIIGADADATKTLQALAATDDSLELYTLARFWLLTRYQSNEAGIAYLRDVLKKHPGELLARTYLGETQLSVGAFADAEATFREALVLAPSSPFFFDRLSKALARQDKHEPAIAAAKKALELAPTSREARLELGSRLIDAGNPTAAVEQLKPLAELTGARGEHLLRLGWAHWLVGNGDEAAASFQKALDASNGAGDWRTRGRAFYDLALVEAKRGRKDAARVALRASVQTGLKLRTVDPLLTEAARDLERIDPDAGRARPSIAPRESSLFPTDSFGEPDVKAKKPPAPEGLVLYRF